MSVKEVMALLRGVNEVDLSFDGDLIYFNFRNKIEVDTWGGFMVGSIYARGEGVFELLLAAQPIRMGENT